jgi:hypothetical protein
MYEFLSEYIIASFILIDFKSYYININIKNKFIIENNNLFFQYLSKPIAVKVQTETKTEHN